MHAIQVSAYGGTDVLQLKELATPELSSGHVLIRLHAVGVNYIDIYHRSGLYKNPLPFVPGMEAAGLIEAVGDEVKEFKVGERVGFAMHLGAYAEYALVPWQKVLRVPKEIEWETAAACLLQGMTAHYLCHDSYPLAPGETALVHAAAGGTGGLLVQMAKAKGARVIATVSNTEKEQRARRLGADEVINYATADFAEKVKELTHGRGVDVVYDSVGVDTFAQSMTCLRPRGFLVLFGQSSGAVAPIDPALLASHGSLFLTRPSLAHYIADRGELVRRAEDVFAGIQQGRWQITIAKKFPLAEAAKAQEALVSRRYSGKILLTV